MDEVESEMKVRRDIGSTEFFRELARADKAFLTYEEAEAALDAGT